MTTQLHKTYSIGIAAALALSMALGGMVFTAFAGHNGAVVEYDAGVCEPTTFTATIADPDGTHKVGSMYLTVDDGDSVQSKNIPTDGSDVTISVGPFATDTTVSWNVFGGGERDYDQPLWNGYGDAGFGAAVGAYAADNGGYGWTTAGVDDPNPFVNWNAVEIEGCYERTAEITSPSAGEDVSGMVDFTAYLDDDDVDAIQWAVRAGTCAAGTGTVFGNVDGHTDVATIDTSDLSMQTFSFTGDMSGLALGSYCFVYNPVEDSGESGIRETVEFNLVEESTEPDSPIEKDECKKGGWEDFGFKNQGQCIRFVETGKDSR